MTKKSKPSYPVHKNLALSEEQKKKLDLISKKMKMNSTEMIRYLIDNFDERLLRNKEIKKINEKKSDELITYLSWFSYNYDKIGVNVNQIAHYMNKYLLKDVINDEDVMNRLLNKMDALINRINEFQSHVWQYADLEEKVDELYDSSGES